MILGEMDYVVKMVFQYQFIIADLSRMEGGVFGPQMFQVKIGIRHLAKGSQAITRLKFMEPVQPVLLPFGNKFLFSDLCLVSHMAKALVVEAAIIGLCVTSGFWIAAFTKSFYGGLFVDPNLEAPSILGLHPNVFAFIFVTGFLVTGLVAGLLKRLPKENAPS